MSEKPTDLKSLIFVPAVITLAVTLLRLTGEVLGWSETFFNRAAGGPMAIVGIVWLVPVFGVYFALKLVAAGEGPAGAGRTIGFALLAMLVFVLPVVTAGALALPPVSFILLFSVAAAPVIWLGMRGWPALGRALLAYGLAVRIPVAIVMLVAMSNHWGTHYEKGPPNFPEMSLLATFFFIGLLPQLTLWIGFTVSVGALFGGIALAVARRRVPATA
jgi:hypothetical protein